MKKTNKNEMDIVFLLDRSGSMGGSETDTIGGYNSYIEKQKNNNVKVTTVLFDHEYEVLHDRKDINDSMELIKYTVNCLNVNNVTDSNIIKRNSNENVQYCTKEYFGKDTYESDIYQEIESFLRN